MRNCWSFFSTFIYEKVGRGYANQSTASRAEKPWSLATGVARNRKPQPYTRNPKPWSLTRRVARNRKPHTHMRKLKPWSLATGVARNQSRTRTTTYTRKPKPWSLATGVARITKPHPYKHVHAQPKGRGPLQQESHASSSRRSTQSNRLQLS
jgi:hypothetical protein